MNNVAIITTAFGNGLEDRNETYAPLAKKLGLSIWFCTKEELLANPKGVEGVIVGVEKADSQLFSCPDLRVAMKFGVGLDNFDIKSAHEIGVEVVNLPGINSDAVAEMTLALMLSVSRMIVPMATSMKKGNFVQFCSHTLRYKKLGIIGMGTIGRKVAHMASAFGMECFGYDVYPVTIDSVKMVDLSVLLSQCDVITVHIPLTDDSFHLIDAKAFSVMKPGVILLNTSRGGIVDEQVLYEQLKQGRIGGAGLDVFENEESMKKLAELDNVVCTPHVSAYTHETLRHMENTALKKIKTCITG